MTRVVAARFAAVVAAVLLTLYSTAQGHLVEALGLGVLLVPLFVWAGDAHNAVVDLRNAEAKAAHAHVGTQRLKPLNGRWEPTDEPLDVPALFDPSTRGAMAMPDLPKDAQRPSAAQREAWDFTFGHLADTPEDAA